MMCHRYTVAEAAVTAVYSLHPQPAAVCEAALRRLAAGALSPVGAADKEGGEFISAKALSHFFFVLGQVGRQGCGSAGLSLVVFRLVVVPYCPF